MPGSLQHEAGSILDEGAKGCGNESRLWLIPPQLTLPPHLPSTSVGPSEHRDCPQPNSLNSVVLSPGSGLF